MKTEKTLRHSILARLKKDLKDSRYRHTLGVESTAIALARKNNVSEADASIAALLHDIAKYLPPEEQIRLVQNTPIAGQYPEILSNLPILHAFAGAEIVRRDYPELSDDIVQAVRYHTTGRANMSVLEKIIYSADYIEPGRCMFPGMYEARERLFGNLDEGVLLSMEQILEYMQNEQLECCILTKEAYESMKILVSNKPCSQEQSGFPEQSVI